MNAPSWLMIDPACGTALEQQIHDGVRTRILDGRLRAGDTLPSSRALAATLGIARSTVTLGYDRLRAAGYIVGQPGSATRVADLPPPLRGARADEPSQTVPTEPTRSLPFAPGIPDLENFPAKLWARCLGARARARDLRLHDLGYDERTGIASLREAIIEHVTRARGVLADPSQVLIMPSAAMILDLLARLSLRQNRTVWLEEPGYLTAREIFQAHNACIVPVPCDADGITVPREAAPALIYVTPSHQYPTGVAMSLPRRLTLLEAAHRHNALIVEDDYDSEFHYEGRPIAALQGIDRNARVAYVGTFSKTLAPGIRVAYAILPRWLMARALQVVEILGGTVPIHVQAALSDFIRDGHFRTHIRRMLPIYEARMEATRAVLAPHFDVAVGQGGLQLVAYCRDPKTDDTALTATLLEHGIGARALSSFYLAQKRSGIVLGIGSATPDNLLKLERVLRAAQNSGE